MKKLIVSGDSYTSKTFRSEAHPEMDVSWDKWPALLAKEWGLECINLARGGVGNEYIYATIQDEIMNTKDKSEIGLVVAGWSQCHREDFTLGFDNHWNHPRRQLLNYATHWQSVRIHEHGDLIYWINKSCRNFLSLQILCERYNIPFIHFSMIHPYNNYVQGLEPTEEDVLTLGKEAAFDMQIQTPRPSEPNYTSVQLHKIVLAYDNQIDNTKFLGWPMDKGIGGYSLNYEVFGWTRRNAKRYYISDNDQHPNAKGQVKLMQWIKEKIENIYNINTEK